MLPLIIFVCPMYDYIDRYPSELWEGTTGNAITYLCPPAVIYFKKTGTMFKSRDWSCWNLLAVFLNIW